MVHGKLRHDNTCQNCGNEVQDRFCSHCAQENTETRQPFHFLFAHFLEDFTHYDGQFWKTIRYLLFSPGKLTNEYLAGKRQQYVAPVKLYIFLSFIVFFVPTLFPDSGNKKELVHITNETIKDGVADSASDKLVKQELDSLPPIKIGEHDIESKADFDSLAKATKKKELGWIRPIVNKYYDLKGKGNSNDEIIEKFQESFIHILPKALFVYLPIFAFLLWLFHPKKEWWFFDHGIFTLHFFSFLLLSIFMITLINEIGDLIDRSFVNTLTTLIDIVLFGYMVAYFFKAHRVVYHSTKKSAFVIGSILFVINLILIVILLLVFFIFSFMILH